MTSLLAWSSAFAGVSLTIWVMVLFIYSTPQMREGRLTSLKRVEVPNQNFAYPYHSKSQMWNL